MKLKFVIPYRTEWGQSLRVEICYYFADGHSRKEMLSLTTQDGETWWLETVVMQRGNRGTISSFDYSYRVVDENGKLLRREWNIVKRHWKADASRSFLFIDQWRDIPLNSLLYSNAYQVIMKRSVRTTSLISDVAVPLFRKTVVFRVSAPQLESGQCLAIVGSHPALGGWNPTRYLLMQPIGNHEWMLSVNVGGVPLPFEYKYIVVDEKTNGLKSWEEGENRSSGDVSLADGEVLVLQGEPLRLSEIVLRAAGVVVPVFSLRSEHSCGVGDFGDLYRLVDWAVETGLRVIQLLPVNDTTTSHTWSDSHPYNIISNHALHPHYLDLEQLGELGDKTKMLAFYRKRRELNMLSSVDYLSVDRVKMAYAWDFFQETGKKMLDTDEFKRFFVKNRSWLEPYASFCVLRDEFSTADTCKWGDYSDFSQDILNRILSDESRQDRLSFIFFIQYHLHLQLLRASEYAHKHSVALKGDLPVGIFRDSVETWVHKDLFNLNEQMGTPPDKETPCGQNWGFPTFKWDVLDSLDSATTLQESLISWWHDRISWFEQYFDAIRVDHILGYFRTWTIPKNAITGLLGHFSPSLPLSVEEIGQFGLTFRREMMTRPFINDNILNRLFGIHADYVRDNFLVKQSYGLYNLKEAFSTQKDVKRHFENRNDEHSEWIREGLMRLTENILFVEDEQQNGMYHPRIEAYKTPVYDMLSLEEKDAYMRLYNNYFYERHDGFWASKADRILHEVFAESKLLVCGEDLGMLPKSVRPVLDRCRILTLEVQSMPKTFGFEFEHLDAYPYRSVATLSTHDMPPLRLWWEENAGRTQHYFTTMLQKEGRAPRELPVRIAEEIIARHLYCPSMLCIFSIQDWLSMDSSLRSPDVYSERINSPFDSFNQWKYRMNVSIEDLLGAKSFNRRIHTMVERSKRI